MGRRRGVRIHRGLPRGGAGLLGYPVAFGYLALAVWAPAGLAVVAGPVVGAACLWCAAGLRRDDEKGEGTDEHTTYRGTWWSLGLVREERSGRHSTYVLILAGTGFVLAAARCLGLLRPGG